MGLETSKLFSGYGQCAIQGRRMSMEDQSLLIPEFCNVNQSLFGIFDGHNGSNCSQFLKDCFPEILSKSQWLENNPSMALMETFKELDKFFLALAKKNDDKSGSTGIVVFIRETQMYIANTGDCRSIVVEDGMTVCLSNDHKPTLPFERSRILESGGQIVCGRVQGTLAVSRAFGDIDFKDTKVLGAGIISSEPEIKMWNITPKTEFVILACDGLWDVLSNESAARFVRERLLKGVNPQTVCEKLVKHAYDIGTNDNVSVIILSFINEYNSYRRRDENETNPDDGGV